MPLEQAATSPVAGKTGLCYQVEPVSITTTIKYKVNVETKSPVGKTTKK